jgi:hypothetical protein
MKVPTITSFLLFISINFQLNAQGWYITASYHENIVTQGSNITFNPDGGTGSTYNVLGINTTENYIALQKDGGENINVPISTYKYFGNGEIVICENLGAWGASISIGKSSTNITITDDTLYTTPGTSIQFSAQTTTGKFLDDSPDFYQGDNGQTWFKSTTLKNSGANVLYTFAVPSTATVGNSTFALKLRLQNTSGSTEGLLTRFTIAVTSTSSVQKTNLLLQGFHLIQNYPNPFNPSTNISFSIPTRSHVTVKIYDVLGKEITTLVDDEMNAGDYTKVWSAANVPSGVYFCRMQAGRFVETKNLILLK